MSLHYETPLLQESFDYPLQSDRGCETLDPLSSLSNQQTQFGSESSNASTIFRHGNNGSFNQSAAYDSPLQTANGFVYRPHPSSSGNSSGGNEISFQAGSGVSMSPLSSRPGSVSTSPSSASSSFAYLPQQLSHCGASASASYHRPSQPSTGPFSQSPAQKYSQAVLHHNIEAKPRLTSIPLVSGMPPPTHASSTNPSPVSPSLGSLGRSEYSLSIPSLSRQTFPTSVNPFHLSPSPQSPLSAMSRSLESSMSRESTSSGTQYGYANPMHLDAGSPLNASSHNVPPFEETKAFVSLTDDRGQAVQADIQAKIDKGFFRADQDWTCYRRNYFSVACSYNIKSSSETEPALVYLHKTGSGIEPVQAFAMCIAAKVDGEDGKPIELVQHTPKRDKGPMSSPDKKELKPNPSGNLGMFAGTSGFGSSQMMAPDYDSVYAGNLQESQNIANFERIQFKKATANNGKRRAAQQYFHIVVELFGQLRRKQSAETEWVKIAHRVSAQMVVRGRSPGHYQDERRNSSTSMGPGGGAGGDYGSAARDFSSAGSSAGGHLGLSGSSYSTRLGPGGYSSHRTSISHSSGAADLSSSSAASSLGSPCVSFIDHLPSANHSIEEPSHSHDSHNYHYYQGGSLGDSASNSSARPSTATGGSHSSILDSSSYGYLTMPPVKEESYTRSSSTRSEPPRRSHSSSSHGLPVFGSHWLPSSDTFQPPKDCRPYPLATTRGYFPATPAL